MISRSGTRRSGASSGVTKILREAASGPVVTAGFSSAVLMVLFMMLLPSGVVFLSVRISKPAKQQPEHDPDRGGNRRKRGLLQHGASGLRHQGGREQAHRATDEAEPAEQGDQYAP